VLDLYDVPRLLTILYIYIYRDIDIEMYLHMGTPTAEKKLLDKVPLGLWYLGFICIVRKQIKKILAYHGDKVSKRVTLPVQCRTVFKQGVIIMGYRYVKYMKLSANALHNALVDRGLSQPEMEAIKRIVDEQKEHKRSEGAHKRQMDLHWDEFLAPLIHERKTVRSIMRYKGSPERDEALEAYLVVLNNVYDKLYLLRKEKNQTPMQIHPERTHWSDYVPQRIRDAVCDAFSAIPYKAKAKTKIPFARTIPVVINTKQRARLERRTRKELAIAERNYAVVDASEKNAQTIDQIKQALRIIRDLKPTDPVPTTWHGLY
jgi:hypothetical protein